MRSPTKRLNGWSLQSEGACATSTNPLPCVSLKQNICNSQETKEKAVFIHRMGNVPSFSVDCGMEFLFGQKIELIL